MTTNAAAIREHVDVHMRRQHAREDTRKHRRANLERLAAALPVDLLDADDDHLFEWQDALRGRGLSRETLRSYTCHARKFYQWATEHGWIKHDPSRDLRPPKVAPGRAHPISEDDLHLAIRCAREPIKTWLILAAYCGLRAGEISRVLVKDIGDETLEVDGKAGEPRTVPLPKPVREHLMTHVKPGATRVFLTACGASIRPHYVSHRCNEALHAVAGPSATLHGARHRFATEVYRLRRDARLVQSLLGHKSLATTQIYLAVDAAEAKGVTDRLASGLTGGNSGKLPAAPLDEVA